MSTDVLDRFYDTIQNVVLRDVNGYPSVFVKHPKVNSSFLDPFLPAHTHPAFTYTNGGEDDAILIGKYHCSSLVQGGAMYSLPNAIPDTVDHQTRKQERIRMTGNQTGLTTLDYGYMFLLANKWCRDHGTQAPCEGNFYNGGDGLLYGDWKVNTAYAVGDIKCYAGWSYQCITAHTSGTATRPPVARAYWERIAKIGGTYVAKDWELDGMYFNDSLSRDNFGYNNGRTLTGSGPINWYFGHDICNEADWLGNVNTVLYGVRFHNAELQVLPYNDCGDPEVPYTTDNTGWKAVLPARTNASYTYVDPGTEGTVKLSWLNNRIVWTTATPASFSSATVQCNLNVVTYDTEAMAVAPSLLYEMGMLPIAGQVINPRILAAVSTGDRYLYWRPERTTSHGWGMVHWNSYYNTPAYAGDTVTGVRSRARFRTT